MKSLSPSSRLVLAAVVLTFLVLAIVGSLRPTTSTPSASAISLGGSGASPSTPGLAAASGTVAGTSPGAEQEASAPAVASTSTDATTAPASTLRPPACVATDQDRYLYNPFPSRPPERSTHGGARLADAPGRSHHLVIVATSPARIGLLAIRTWTARASRATSPSRSSTPDGLHRASPGRWTWRARRGRPRASRPSSASAASRHPPPTTKSSRWDPPPLNEQRS